jgi:hypothetical protein
MSEADAHTSPSRGIRGFFERVNKHRQDTARRREEEELAKAAEGAAFDIATDIAHPTAGHAAVGFDVEIDVGVDNEPPELRQ